MAVDQISRNAGIANIAQARLQFRFRHGSERFQEFGPFPVHALEGEEESSGLLRVKEGKLLPHKAEGAVHLFGEGKGIVGEKVKDLFPQREQRRGFFIRLPVGFDQKAQGIAALGQQARRLFAAQAEAHLGPAGVVVIKARMQGADIAKAVLTQLNDQAAQTVRKQEGAALVFRQTEMGRRFRFDLPPQLAAQLAGDTLVILQRVLIYIDLPSDTAAMAAGGGETAEIVIKIGPYRKHGAHLPQSIPQPPALCNAAGGFFG